MHNRDIFLCFINMKVCCVFSLECDFNEYTQYTIFNIQKRNSPLIILNLQLLDLAA